MARLFYSMLIVLTTLAALPAHAVDYTQAPGSILAFAGKYQGEVFVGSFPGFTTKLSFDAAHPEAALLEVDIPLARATAGNDDYDGELRGAAFFNAVKFPHAHYRASGFRSSGDGRYVADGTLSLRGVDKPVRLTLTWTPGAKPVLAGKATVKRLDFGVGGGDWADTALIPNDIAISTKLVLQPAK